jgi:hypothetical protein
MSIQIVKDGQVIRDDNKPSQEDRILQQEKIIQDLQNQIKDLKSKKTKK